jgi:hypothetical protein
MLEELDDACDFRVPYDIVPPDEPIAMEQVMRFEYCGKRTDSISAIQSTIGDINNGGYDRLAMDIWRAIRDTAAELATANQVAVDGNAYRRGCCFGATQIEFP